MVLRFLLRGGIYILFVMSVIVGWLLRRRSQKNKPDSIRPVIVPEQPSEALQHSQWQVRLQAVQNLAQQPVQTALPALLAALCDPDSDVREAAIHVVSGYGKAAVVPLLNLLETGTRDAREAAAQALREIADPSAIPGLTAALHDESAWVRQQAARALGVIQQGEAAEALSQALEIEQDADVKHVIQASLSQMSNTHS